MKNRLLLLSLVLVIVAGLIVTGCSTPEPSSAPEKPASSTPPSAAEPEVIELNFSYHAPQQSGLAEKMIIPWANDLEAACNGRIKIVHHGGGSLLGAEDVYDGILSGICDLGQIAYEEYPGRFPISGFNALPMVWPNTEIAGIVSHIMETKYCVDSELSDIQYMLALPLNPMEWLGKKPLEKAEDFQGMKIRVAGQTDTQIVEAFGGTPVHVVSTDLYSALDKGMVDGAFFALSGALAFGLADVTEYRTECGLHQNVFAIFMNKQVFNDLPGDIKEIFKEYSTPEMSRKYSAAHMAVEPNIKGAIKGKDEKVGNPPFYILPDDERVRWDEKARVVREAWAGELDGQGLPGHEILDELMKLVKQYK